MIVIWHCDVSPPPSHRWPADLGVPVLVKTRNIKVTGLFKFLLTYLSWTNEVSLKVQIKEQTNKTKSRTKVLCLIHLASFITLHVY